MEDNNESSAENRLEQLKKAKAALLGWDKRLEALNSLTFEADPAASREELLECNKVFVELLREFLALVTDQHGMIHADVEELACCWKRIKQLEAEIDGEGEEWKRGD